MRYEAPLHEMKLVSLHSFEDESLTKGKSVHYFSQLIVDPKCKAVSTLSY